MKIVHWSAFPGSGMNNVAESLQKAEKAAGLDSIILNGLEDSASEESWEKARDADVHVTHTHFPEWFRRRCRKDYRFVYVAHGTPEHVFNSSLEEGLRKGHGHGDSWMLMQHWMKTADVTVTFWERHAWFYKSLCDKHTRVECLPLGVDRGFWKPGTPAAARFAGAPSLLTCENPHRIKSPFDLFVAWPHVDAKLPNGGCLHAFYVVLDQHRWFFPLVNRNGCSYASHISAGTYSHPDLCNALRSVDYYIGLVRYGDFNRMSLEANAVGVPTISYAGNPYSSYWITEGDQRGLVSQLTDILTGVIDPRHRTPVPDISETCNAFLSLYASL